MHHYFRSYCFYLIPNYGEEDGYYPSLWMIQLTLDSPIQFLIFYKFLQKHYKKKPKIFFFVVQLQRRKSHS